MTADIARLREISDLIRSVEAGELEIREALKALPELLDAEQRAADAIADRDAAIAKAKDERSMYYQLANDLEAMKAKRDAAIAREQTALRFIAEQNHKINALAAERELSRETNRSLNRRVQEMESITADFRWACANYNQTDGVYAFGALKYERDRLAAQLAECQARAAAMRSAAENLLAVLERDGGFNLMARTRDALSPNAGAALLAELEALRALEEWIESEGGRRCMICGHKNEPDSPRHTNECLLAAVSIARASGGDGRGE